MARKAPKSRAEVLIERLRQRGYELHTDQVGARFRFIVSPTTTGNVDIGKFAVEFRDEVFRLIKNAPFESPLTGVVLFPTILDPLIATMPDTITHKRRDKAYFVSVNIPFALWAEAAPTERVDLFADNLIESIDRIPGRHLAQADCQILTEAVNNARRTIRTSMLN